MEVARDRQGDFEPQVGKYQRWLAGLDTKILQQRGLEDVFIFCVDGLKGFPEAIGQVYPEARMQLCIIHPIRNSMAFVPWKQRKKVKIVSK